MRWAMPRWLLPTRGGCRRCPDLWRQRGIVAGAGAEGQVVLGAGWPNAERAGAWVLLQGSGFAELPRLHAGSLTCHGGICILYFRGSGLFQHWCLHIIQTFRTVVPAQGTTAVNWEEGSPRGRQGGRPAWCLGLALVSPALGGMSPGSPFTLSPPLSLFCSGLS